MSVVAATLTHPYAFRHNDLLGNVVLAHEHAVGAEILGTAGFGAGGTALADHHNLPVRGAAEVFLVLCRCLGEAKLVRAAGDQGAWRCGFEKVGPLFEATESPDRNHQQHESKQDASVQCSRRDGLTCRRARFGRILGWRPVGIDCARVGGGGAVLGLSWGRLHRLSVGSHSAELAGDT